MTDYIDRLIGALDHEDILVAAHAARLLGQVGRREAVAPLLRYVTESQFYTKVAGLAALARIGDPSACDSLAALVDQPNVTDDWFWYACRSVRGAAAVALLALKDPRGGAYLNELADRDDDVVFVWWGVAILRLPNHLPETAALKGRITVEALRRRGDRGVRCSDAATLAMKATVAEMIGDEEACRLLCELAGHSSRYVRGQAAVSLLLTSPTDDHVALVRRMAAEDSTEFGRMKAALALARTGCKEMLAPITRAAEAADDPFDRAAAVEALGLLGHKDDLPTVLAQADHDDAYVRLCAVEAADRIAPTARNVTALARRLADDDPDPRVQLQAAKLLAARDKP
ncbi:MAG TPA: HEAT repeat domain-containing protein [Phycisphaerae bacterium]|nr:HEAT repeat domain-containing protein [Phycisphaerae bacterium]